MITTAFVKLWGDRVGAVAWNPATGLASFEYEPRFIEKQIDLSPLKMPIANAKGRIFSFPELRDLNTFKGLPGLLADTLPDAYGNQLINTWLVQNGRPENSMNPVEMLCFIGNRGMGALEFEPAQLKASTRATDLEIRGLVDITQKILNRREGFETNLNDTEQQALIDILKVGTSAGGARPKAIIAYNEKTGQIKSGQTLAPKGFEHWLIKLDAVSDAQYGASVGYGRVEMAYYLMAKACDIEMMECRMIEENGRAHFMTKRFDRENGAEKHHIQTLCAMQHYDYTQTRSYSYEQLFQTMRLLQLPYTAAEELYKRMVLNVLARNCDDHSKNFAFRLKQNSSWELTPAYDISHAYRPGSDWVSQHNLSINGKRTDFVMDDFLFIAKQMNIKKAKKIISNTQEIVNNWNYFADKTGVEEKLKMAIGASHLNL
jgi:serine/threonine-protein kinase HipA